MHNQTKVLNNTYMVFIQFKWKIHIFNIFKWNRQMQIVMVSDQNHWTKNYFSPLSLMNDIMYVQYLQLKRHL